MISSLIYWVQNTGSKVWLRSRRDRKTAIFSENDVARRITLGLDEAGFPVLGIPFVDKPVWGHLTFQRAIFSWYGKNPVAADGSLFEPGDPVTGDFHLGIVVADKSGEVATLWVPTASSKLFKALTQAPINLAVKGEYPPPGIIRVVYYAAVGENQATWIEGEDYGVCKISVIKDEPLEVDVADRSVPQFSPKGMEIIGIDAGKVPEALRQKYEFREGAPSGAGAGSKKGGNSKRHQTPAAGKAGKNSPRGRAPLKHK